MTNGVVCIVDMIRPLRVNIANGGYHCMNRGIDRARIYSDERDYPHFVELLGELMGGSDYAAVYVGLKRFDSRLAKDGMLRKTVAQVEEMVNV